MKRLLPSIGFALFLAACTHPTVEFVDFETFHLIQVKSSDIILEDGTLNPEVRLMEDPADGETKVACTDIAGIARNMLGILNNKKVIHIAGTYKGRDKTSEETARLYKALMMNSVLNFMPQSPVYLYHSRQDDTVPFENALKAENYFRQRDIRCDFGNYGAHTMGCARFILRVYDDL